MLLLALSIASCSVKRDQARNGKGRKSDWYWNGQPIKKKALDDSMRVLFFQIHDSIEKTRHLYKEDLK